jgi:hypothetical protein
VTGLPIDPKELWQLLEDIEIEHIELPIDPKERWRLLEEIECIECAVRDGLQRNRFKYPELATMLLEAAIEVKARLRIGGGRA